MVYLSKGIALGHPAERSLRIFRCGQAFQLTGTEADVWLEGRCGFAVTDGGEQERALSRLSDMGLAWSEPEDTNIARYRIMAGCICCPADFQEAGEPLTSMEERVLCWLRNAGIRLSAAELIYLQENQIKPEPGLLYLKNRQTLIELIYLQNPVADNLLENRMEAASCRDEVVMALAGLLKKKRILVL